MYFTRKLHGQKIHELERGYIVGLPAFEGGNKSVPMFHCVVTLHHAHSSFGVLDLRQYKIIAGLLYEAQKFLRELHFFIAVPGQMRKIHLLV